MKNILIYIALTVVSFSIIYGVWYVGKSINYNLSYKSMVEDTVRELVKDECLKLEK